MKSIFVLLGLINLFSAQALFGEREREFRRGRGAARGNEQSERVTPLAIGEPTYGGIGCPKGTVRAVFAPDYLSFTLLFDDFVAEVDGSGKRRDAMNCTVILPLQIPARMQMEITRVDFRGFVGLPASAHAILHSVFNFQGPRGDRDRLNLRYRFQGPVTEDYDLSSDLLSPAGAPESERSTCGGNVRLRIVNQLRIVSRTPNESAMVTLDSIDGSNNAVYYVNWRACR